MYQFHISPYSPCIIMIICIYVYIYIYIYTLYILKHTINYDLLSVCDICILCIVLTTVEA